jgi:SAM-dependent methyltransferase
METIAETPVQQVHKWYAENAAKFEDAIAIESPFTKLTREEQRRLNRYELWFLEQGGLVPLAGKTILEFGCGHGRMAIETRGYESYLGVDFCAELIAIGQQRLERAGLQNRARLVASDCMLFDAPEAAFDVVCSLGMFSFVEDPQKTLIKMASHLKPGGVLFMDGHNSSRLFDPLRRLLWRLKRKGGRPKRVYGEAQLHAMFARAGLSDVTILMKEYPFLGMLYARRGWGWLLALRNLLVRIRWLNILGTEFIAIGRKKPAATPASG